MKTSVIQHPAANSFVLLREWQVRATGNHCAAALLNMFESFHRWKLEQLQQSRKWNDIAEKHGDSRSQLEGLYIWKTLKEIGQDLIGLYGKSAIVAAIKILKNLGFISIHSNPNPRYHFDKTQFFLFHPDAVNKWLRENYREDGQATYQNRKQTIDELKTGDRGEGDLSQAEINSPCAENSLRCAEINSPQAENGRSTIYSKIQIQDTDKNTYQNTDPDLCAIALSANPNKDQNSLELDWEPRQFPSDSIEPPTSVHSEDLDPEPSPSSASPPPIAPQDSRKKTAARRMGESAATVTQVEVVDVPSNGKKAATSKKEKSWVFGDAIRSRFSEVWNLEKPAGYAPIGLDVDAGVAIERKILRGLIEGVMDARELDWREPRQLEEAIVATLDMIRGALRWAKADSFYGSKAFSLRELAGNGKIQDLYSKFRGAAIGQGALPQKLEEQAALARFNEMMAPFNEQRRQREQAAAARCAAEQKEIDVWNRFMAEWMKTPDVRVRNYQDVLRYQQIMARHFQEWQASLEADGE
jgi:hypothetical protein